MSSETEDHEKQPLATLKRLNQGDQKVIRNIMICFSHSSLYAPNNLYLILIVAFQ